MRSRRQYRRIAQLEDRRLLKLEKKYARQIARALNEQAIHYIEVGEISNSMFPVIENLYKEQLEYWMPYQYQQLERETKKRSRFFMDRWGGWIQQFVITELVTKVKAIDDVTRNKIKDIVADGAVRGLQHEVIAENIRSAFAPKETIRRGMTIARTETAGAVNAAKEHSSEDWERETGNSLGKLWIHRGAKNPREWHLDLDTGIPIPKEDDFYVFNPETGNGEYMSRPHSEGASAENIINCGCQIIYTRWNN